MTIELKGYRRQEGVWGVRNHVLVLASVSCANHVVERLGRSDPDVIAVTHQHGCAHLGHDRQQVLRTLAGTCANPNVGAVLVVGLGCESVGASDIAQHVPSDGRMVRTIVIQEIGRAEEIHRQAMAAVAEMKDFTAAAKREPFDISALVVGLECGGSDPFSGIAANPTIGLVSDRLVELGATVILSEIPEMIGAEEALARRIADPATRRKLLERIEQYVETARSQGCDLRGVNPTPGNIKAGLSTIEEKSLGSICKGGRSPIGQFVEYAAAPTRRGLVVMDTPGQDPESLCGMAAGGAGVMIFSTGMGTPLGHPVAPVIKVASNSAMAARMADYIDLDAGRILAGRPMQHVADDLLRLLLEVCNGQPTKSERNACREFAISRIGMTY
ncbi:MAG TPA: UxaA family hydrolase [Thermoguttaceae bacterium]|nr:UxaA family hydrolase [Thermoguttaceae bacterium]